MRALGPRLGQLARHDVAGMTYGQGRRTGRSLDANNVWHHFQAVLAAAGLPRQRFHDLRHCAATLRLEQGEELAVVSRILGHASLATTADVYGHLTDAMLERAAEQTDVILGRPPATA